MEYQIVNAQGSVYYKVVDELNEKVNKLLQEGWVLQGGVAQSITKYEWHFVSQAMVKMSSRNEIRKI